MKSLFKIIFSILLVLFQYDCSKDNDINIDYYPFVVQDKIWATGMLGIDYSKNELYPATSDYIKIGHDTLFEGLKWFIIYKSYDEDHNQWEKWGYIKEDSKQVMYIGPSEKVKLLYDFNLKQGDEFQPSSTIYSVDSIKYLPISNGEKRKHIYLSPPNAAFSQYVLWIEGIGSTSGFFMNTGNLDMVGSVFKLLCCQENDTYLYTDTVYNTCYFNPN